MANEFLSPNLHVILIHYPLGLLTVGILIELFGFLWRHSSFRTAGRWMILLGALSAIPATFSGIYALADVARTDNATGDAPWVDVRASSPVLSQPAVWHLMRQHVLLQSVATALCVLAVVVWLGCSDDARGSLHLAFMLLLLGGLGCMVVGAWNSGEAVYRHGVAVRPVASTQTSSATTDEPQKYPLQKYVEKYLPPLVEVHAIAAGLSVAIALAAIGLSFRKINATFEVDEIRPLMREGPPLTGQKGPRNPPNPMEMVRSFNPDIEMTVHPFAPASRFWLLTCLLALLTAAGGALIIINDDNIFQMARQRHMQVTQVFWNQIKPDKGEKVNRLLGHLAMGTTIILVPLILAAIARWAPRRRFIVGFFTLILIVAVSAQIWLGILLLLDTSDGPVTKFNISQTAAEIVKP